MKILFMGSGGEDYQCDSVFHGLMTEGHEVYVNRPMAYMYQDYAGGFYSACGKGYTLYRRLARKAHLLGPQQIVNGIQAKAFDRIIYGSLHRSFDFLPEVMRAYDWRHVALIDGEDAPGILTRLANGFPLPGARRYFKRECLDGDNALPIAFAMPGELIVRDVPPKTKEWCPIIPGDISTYILTGEGDYYAELQRSGYARTHKKGGWDCLRHYEILANGCVPWFVDLAQCPRPTLHTLPKAVLLEIQENNVMFQPMRLKRDYTELVRYLLEYTRQHLTTVALARYVLERLQ